MNALCAVHDVAVNSIGPSPSYDDDGIRYVGISANLTGTIANIHNLLFATESATPILLVKSAKFFALRNAANSQVPAVEPQIGIQLTIFGALDPNTDEKT